MKELYNDNQIVLVSLVKSAPAMWIGYFKEIKFLGYVYRKEGFYYNHYPSFFKLDRIPENRYVNENVMYEKDHIIVEYSNGTEKNVYFNSYKEAENYVKKEFSGREWRTFE